VLPPQQAKAAAGTPVLAASSQEPDSEKRAAKNRSAKEPVSEKAESHPLREGGRMAIRRLESADSHVRNTISPIFS
jgi:hypothetical protein